MSFERVHRSRSQTSQTSSSTSQFAPRPFSVEQPKRPPTQADIENEAFQHNKFEAFGLQLKEKHGTITHVEQERLGVLQTKMDSFWAQRMKRASSQPNILSILIHNAQPAQTTEPKATTPSNAIQAKGDTERDRPESSVEQPLNKTGLPDALKAGVENLSGYSLPSISDQKRVPLSPEVQREAMHKDDNLQAKSILPRQEAIDGGNASTDLESSINRTRGSGQPLDAGLQQSMGQAMGADFSGVKIHTDAQSDQLNQSIQAKAFTTGQDVFFRQGEYNPGSRGGQELIAHELTHVVQPNGGAVQRSLDPSERGHDRESPSLIREAAPPHTPVVQRAIIADGLEGAGRIEQPERESFNGLLSHNNFDPLAFTDADYEALKGKYDGLTSLDDKVVSSKAGKKVKAKADLKVAYEKLLVDIKAAMLDEGKPTWDAAVGLAIQQYNALSVGEQLNTNAQYKTISKPVWPTVGGRGAMPESFWKSVKKNIKTGFGAAVGGAAAFSAECEAIYADMRNQFTAWDGTQTNRGAWWGSAAPGVTAGVKNVSSTVILELQSKVAGSQWKFSNSFTGGISFHKTRGGVDFIYHMQAP